MDVLEFFWKKNSKCVCVDVNTIWTGDRTVSTLALDNGQKFNSFLEFRLSNFWEDHIRAPEPRLEIQSIILRAAVLFTELSRALRCFCFITHNGCVTCSVPRKSETFNF